MRSPIVLGWLAFFIISCGSDKRIPEDVLPEEKMGTVLFEIGMGEAMLEYYVFRDSTVNRDSSLRSELDKVLQVHQLSQEDFRRSFEYYKARPALMKVMMDTVYARSQRSQEKLYGKRPKGRRPQVDTTQKK
ncbi:MAG: DUF4296 domain-containing protein [Chitinophagaceae bacterium]|jgi:hypothetical protein|nr:DUF4296 domain-containing protein [Chitinophagaceae bacterium]